MKPILTRARKLSMFILAIAFLGCTDVEDILPSVTSAFTYTINEDTGTVTFINLSEGANKYAWDFGDGTTSSEINPIKAYTATGTYTVSLVATNVSGASDTSEDVVSILIKQGISLPITFDDANVAYEATTFSGASFEIVDNPDVSGSNDKASKVGAITNAGNAFEGIFFDLETPVDLTTQKTITMNFWAEAPVPVLLKLEEGTSAAIEFVANHGGTGWEEIAFNFDSEASYSRLTLFVDGPGTTAGTFYVDDIAQVAGGEGPDSGCADTPVAAAALPVDFEGCETFLSSDNFGAGLTSELAPNPSKSGINTSDFVLKVDKPTGSDFFAGIQNTFENNLDLTTTDVFKLKVYSTKANVVFRFELLANPNDGSIGNPAPVFVTVPVANEWTEVEFTFTGLPAGPTAYRQLVIKPDNDQTDSPITNGGTYYLDDLTLTDGDSGGSGFDDGLLTNGDFENGTDSWIGGGLNVVTEGGNSFNLVNVTVAGNPFDVNISQVLDLTQDADYILTFDASSDRARTIIAGIGLNVAPFTNTSQTVNLTTGTQTFTLNLNATGFGGPDSRVLFDMGAEVGTVVIDNVSLVLDGGGSATSGCAGTPVAATALPLDFEGCETFLSDLNFGAGLTSGFAANPSKSGINTSDFVLRVDKPTGSEFFAGIQNVFPSNFDLTTTNTFRLKVYSTKANVVFRFELLANPNDGSIGNPAPVFVTVPVANEWTEVEFTFTGLPAGPTAYSQLVIKPDNDQADSPITDGGTYYLDDLRLE